MEKTFKEYSDAMFDAILQPPKPITDQELDKEITRLRELEDQNNREGWNISTKLAELISEKQRRWAKTLSPEDISNL